MQPSEVIFPGIIEISRFDMTTNCIQNCVKQMRDGGVTFLCLGSWTVRALDKNIREMNESLEVLKVQGKKRFQNQF